MANQYDREARLLERRRQLAEALRASGNEALPASLQTGGRFDAPVSGWQHANKALQQILGGLSERQVNKAEKELTERQAKAQADWMRGLPEAQAPSELQPVTPTGQLMDTGGDMGAISTLDLDPNAPADTRRPVGLQEQIARRIKGSALRGDVQETVDAGDRQKLLAHYMKGGEVGGVPEAIGMAGLQRELLPPVAEDYTLGEGDRRFSGSGKVIAEVGPKTFAPKEPGKMGTEDVSVGGGQWQTYVTNPDGSVNFDKPVGKPFTKRATASDVNVALTQEKAFEKALGEGQGKAAVESKQAADDAAATIATINQGREILNKGIISGFAANKLVSIGQALRQAGFSVAEGDLENTQAYAAAMAGNVGRVIKLFGAGTGLSDADREYAQKMVGGEITLDEKALQKILDINERAARNLIDKHNKTYGNVKSTIPLTVEVPSGMGPVSPTGNGGLTPEEEKELEALRKQFGGK